MKTRFLAVMAVVCSLLLTGVAVADTQLQAVNSGSPRSIKFDMTGPDVVALQTRLKKLRYYCGAKIDGRVGPKTQRCIINFQRSHRLEDDGVVGPKTRAALASARIIRVGGRCATVKYCILVKVDQQIAYLKSPKLKDGILIIGISSGEEVYYTDKICDKPEGQTCRPSELRVMSGFSHTPRGVGWLGTREWGNRYSKLCSAGRSCMINPIYIDGGPFGYHRYAFHGSISVPAFPASHGCIRVPTELTNVLWRVFPRGKGVTVVVNGPNFDRSASSAPTNS